MAADIPRRELENIQFMFEIMADPQTGLDAVDLGDGLRVLNLNPTMEMVKKLGGTERRNEKKITYEEFIPIYAELKKEKEQGCYEDFLECLKLYDKNENGLMLLSELNYAIRNLGEPLDDYQGDELMEDCVGPDEEDDDGFIPYHKFLARMCCRDDILNA
ncbi:myosin light chain alkali isoform X2 [Condylostylus longicornis]|uniref:myosin light chain alkali isoform X2 n=1 Tax=Condylostylus longicornis TaxID=2530218 RepID=UPI00244E2C62|nr:myosin light chain alkali isoform X2 [Condylostylus longicornis]